MCPAKELVRLILLDACPYYYLLLVHMRIRVLHIYMCVLISRRALILLDMCPPSTATHEHTAATYVCANRGGARTPKDWCVTGALLFVRPPPCSYRERARSSLLLRVFTTAALLVRDVRACAVVVRYGSRCVAVVKTAAVVKTRAHS